ERHPFAFVDPAQVRGLLAGPLDPWRVLRLEIPVRRERNRAGVRLEDAACVGRADDHALVDLKRHREELAAGLFLEDVVVRLNAAEIMLPHRGASFLETAGARAEGDAVIPDLAFRFQRLEGLPDRGVPDRRRIGIVQLEHVDVRGPEATRREGPDAETDLRYLEFGLPKGPIVDHAVPPRPQRRRGYLTATPAVASARRRRGGSRTRPAPRRCARASGSRSCPSPSKRSRPGRRRPMRRSRPG